MMSLLSKSLSRSLSLFGVIFSAATVLAEPFVPKDGSAVLETLRLTAVDPAVRKIREERALLSRNPTNLALACDVARLCIERSRSEADPRFLGRAQAALAPWWNMTNPPVDALVLRATLKQSQHEFTNALVDLALAGHLQPRNPQIWLTRATVLAVLGDYKGARKACIPLAELAPGLVALTSIAGITSLTGEATRSCALLRRALDGNPSANVGEKIWALTVLGEAEERLGKSSSAESDFKSALALEQRDPYLMGAYADLLLEEKRAPEVVDLLRNENRADALLLRLTEAEATITPPPSTLATHVAELAARFEAGHMRGDFVHQREESRFALHLQHQPETALRLAVANWQVQHEPADLLVLMESALAAGKPAAAQPAVEFMRTNHMEDVALSKLARELSPMAEASR